jgi:hypothetical protein
MMLKTRLAKLGTVLAGLGLALALVGCRIDTRRDGNGENVKIATPFGGVQVKTDSEAVSEGIGIAVYPHAELEEKNGKDNGSADVNVSVGSLRVRVKAIEYHSDDAQEKVIAFYRKELGKYGGVIQCRDGRAVDSATQTPEGLSCDDEHKGASSDSARKIELKAGSKQHQHLVAVDGRSSGTKFSLIVLDLPASVSFGNNASGDK